MTDPTHALDTATLLRRERWVRRIAGELLADPHDVDDAVQVGLWRSLSRGPDRPAALRTYLRRIIENFARNRRRDAARRRHYESRSHRTDVVPSAAEMAERAEFRQRLTEAVLRLDDRYREVVWLRFFEDLPPRETARRLGVPIETVRTRLRRGLERLRADLDSDYGDRRSWALLAPFGICPPLGAALVLSIGGLAMKKTVAAAVAALVLLAVGWQMARPASSDAPATARSTIDSRVAAPTADGSTERTDLEAAAETPSPPPATAGVLHYHDGSTATGLAYRPFGARRPYWAEPHEEPKLISRSPEFAPDAPRTGLFGEWMLPDAATAIAVRVHAGLVVTFEIESEGPRTLVLPELTNIEIIVDGTHPSDRVDLRVNAYVRGNGVVRTWPTPTGQVTVAVLDQDLVCGDDERPAVRVLSQWDYRVLAFAPGLKFDDWDQRTRAPAVVAFRAMHRRPLVEVRVLESENGEVAAVDGRLGYVQLKTGAAGTGRIHGGRESLDLDPKVGDRYRLRVLLDSGELFEETIERLSPDEELTVELVRGTGSWPIRVHLPADGAEDRVQSVLFVGKDHELGFAIDNQRERVYLGVVPIWLPHADGGIQVVLPPDDWRTLYVLTRDGRVGMVERSGDLGEYWTAWLPDEAIAAPDLAAAHRAAGSPRRGYVQLMIGVPNHTGDTQWVALRTFHFDATTESWPRWNVRAPVGWRIRTPVRVDRVRGVDDQDLDVSPARQKRR